MTRSIQSHSAKTKRRKLVLLRVCAAATAGLQVLPERKQHSCYTCYSSEGPGGVGTCAIANIFRGAWKQLPRNTYFLKHPYVWRKMPTPPPQNHLKGSSTFSRETVRQPPPHSRYLRFLFFPLQVEAEKEATEVNK